MWFQNSRKRRVLKWAKTLRRQKFKIWNITVTRRTGAGRPGYRCKSRSDLSDFFLCIPQLPACCWPFRIKGCRKYLWTSDQSDRGYLRAENCSTWRRCCGTCGRFGSSRINLCISGNCACRGSHCSCKEYLRWYLQPSGTYASGLWHWGNICRSVQL